MKITYCSLLGFLMILSICCQGPVDSTVQLETVNDQWPDTLAWWKRNNLRLMQTNLPAYEAELNVDSLIQDLRGFSVNTLLINAGGIMAFYPTKLDFHYINPYMQESMLENVISRCHQLGIRVIVRFDFSRMHRTIFEAHPDWCYVAPTGERIINDDMYLAAINAPYVQQRSIDIVSEVIDNYPIDGLFINMPGYHTRNHYADTYHGIDQNPHDARRFFEFSGGLSLPLHPDVDDPVYQRYEEFKEFTVNDWMQRMHQAVKSRNDQIAICTYMPNYVDIIRHESQTNSLPYWPYMSSDNVSNVENSYPDHIVSNASIQQISFKSRFNAIEPEETAIRLYENIANGSGLDMSLMGDFRDYEDERNFDIFRTIYAHHKKYEPYYGNYASPAEIAVIAPGYWPGGESAQEYRGIQLMLKEAHIPFDIIEDGRVGQLPEKVAGYRLILLPDISHLDSLAVEVLELALDAGTNLIATNHSFYDDPRLLERLFGAKIINKDHDGFGYYLAPENKKVFTRFAQQDLLFWKFNLGLYDLSSADEVLLPILTPGRPGPPEKIGGHEPTGYYALGIKDHGKGSAAILPINLGRLYFLHGYEQHKNILLDIVELLFPEASDLVKTNAHPRVEIIPQNYVLNIPENIGKMEKNGMILHLVNISGFSGNTYFEPHRQIDLNFRIRSEFKPSEVIPMIAPGSLEFTWDNGYVEFELEELNQYEGVILKR